MIPRVLFIHRSCGAHLLAQGRVRELLPTHEVAFSDYDNNKHALTGPDGRTTSFTIPLSGDNTTPTAYATFFSDYNAHDPQLQILLRDYDTIVIKSCYTANAIQSDADLEKMHDDYESIIKFFHDRIHLALGIVTAPPLHPKKTNVAEATRARRLANWLETTDFGPNIRVFDFYGQLADDRTNMLAPQFQRLITHLGIKDSHPNAHANHILGPAFAEWVRDLPRPALT